MKRILSISILFLLALTMRGQASQLPDTLSPTGYIAVMTCGPGNEIGENFGHCAIRVCDTAQRLDIVYNYGTYNFNEPHFVWNFCKGKLDYYLSVEPFWIFANSYAMTGRSVEEQRLALTEAEKNKIYHALDSNAHPMNRMYAYDFFIDNCATRPRDIINNNLIDRTLFVERTSDTNLSYRQLLYPYIENTPWLCLGIDLVLGARCDRKISNIEYMFAPDQLRNQLDTTLLSDTLQPLAKNRTTICSETRILPSCAVSPLLSFWVLCVIVTGLTIIGWAKKWKLRWLDTILFAIAGLCSVFLLFMWFGTEHYCTKANLNILWASPLFLYFAVRSRKSWKPLVLLQILSLLMVMAGFWWLPQRFNAAVFPLALSLFIRLLDNCRTTAS